jgi:hypothetical protein
MVKITITERGPSGKERLISTRSVAVESKKQLTRQRACKILAREHPELGIPMVINQGPGFWTTKAMQPSEKCAYHFSWRDYYIAEE